MNKLIGIIGKKYAGKTVIADYLEKNPSYRKMSFATPLKQIAIIMGFPPDSLITNKETTISTIGMSPRVFLQRFGTEFGRDIFPKLFPEFQLKESTLWIQLFDNELKRRQKIVPSEVCVIDDVRFQDEVDYIVKNGGILIRVHRPYDKDYCEEYHDTHKSEQQAPNLLANFEIINNSTLDDLYSKVDKILNLLLH